MLYEVRFAGKFEGVNANAWAPREGDDYQVGKREALRRRDHLIECSRKGEAVDGVVPDLVEVVDETGKVMFAITPTADETPSGAWAKAAS